MSFEWRHCLGCVTCGQMISLIVSLMINNRLNGNAATETSLCQPSWTQQIGKYFFKPPQTLSVRVCAAAFPFDEPRHSLTGELARWDSFGFPRWKPAPTLSPGSLRNGAREREEGEGEGGVRSQRCLHEPTMGPDSELVWGDPVTWVSHCVPSWHS